MELGRTALSNSLVPDSGQLIEKANHGLPSCEGRRNSFWACRRVGTKEGCLCVRGCVALAVSVEKMSADGIQMRERNVHEQTTEHH